MKVAVIFGGISTEHDVSIVSGTSVIKNLDKERYDILPIYIDKNGEWYKYTKPVEKIEILKIGNDILEKEKIDNIIETLQKVDVIFPVLHGIGGEDGSIQGLFKMINKPYVGCGIFSSCAGMDKVYAKVVFDKAGLNQTPYVYLRKFNDNYIYIDDSFNEKRDTLENVCNNICSKLKYPMFIKPSNSGSSVGINKATNFEELLSAIEYAAKYDKKIIIEQGINGREIECAVLGNEDVIASCVGEVLPADSFYSFDAKYINSESKTMIPANIENDISEKIRNLAIKAFKSIDGKGLSRVDFFVENGTNKIYINEINTMPGFTQISMYPQLFDNVGLSYKKLLDKLIELAFE